MKRRFDLNRNLVIIEMDISEDIALGNICQLADYYNKNKSIKEGCDCAEECYKLFVQNKEG